jgi:RNA-directed DNA polymerase
MTHGLEKSDRRVVPQKPSNKAERSATEKAEGRSLAKGNPLQDDTNRIQGRRKVNSALERIRQAAERDKKVKFTSLVHHIYSVDMLREAYFSLEREAAPGVDGETWQHYGEDLEEHLRDLSERLARGAYRASPVQRVYVPKPDGRQRPIGVPVLEDKLVQRATVAVLNQIYETEFLGFSYGFRPGRSQHDALEALESAIVTRKVDYLLDADIRGFFDAISHEWTMKFGEHRIADKRVIRLIQKWLKAGVLEDGTRTQAEEGTPQGGSASPLLANIYLHYVFDLWVQQWRKKRAHGEVIVVRFCDDFIVGFQYRFDAEQFLAELKERLRKFSLELHPEKTRLIEFGRFAAADRKQRQLGKPETFDFLGLTHICGTTRNGKFTVKRKTVRRRLRAKLKEVHAELRRRLHDPIPEVGQWLRSVVNGHCRYYGVTGNSWCWRQV